MADEGADEALRFLSQIQSAKIEDLSHRRILKSTVVVIEDTWSLLCPSWNGVMYC